MVIHSAFTAALVHLVLFEHPQIATYHACFRGLKTIVSFLKWVNPSVKYARMVLEDIKDFALTWNISPANSRQFWDETPWTVDSLEEEVL
jgi:hypothetical protein